MPTYEFENGMSVETKDVLSPEEVDHLFREIGGNKAPDPVQEPKNQDLLSMIGSGVGSAQKAAPKPLMQRMGNAVAPIADAIQPFVKPGLQTAGAIGGGLIGALGGPAGIALGAGGGMAAGGQIGNLFNQMGGYEKPKGLLDTGLEIGTDVATGVAGELVAPALAVAKTGIGKVVGNTARNAMEGGKDFTRAMWGKVTGEDIAKIAQKGVADLKAGRATDYRQALEKISEISNPIPKEKILNSVDDLLKEFNIGTLPYSPKQMAAQDKGNSLNMLKQYTDMGIPLKEAQSMAMKSEATRNAKLYSREFDFSKSPLDSKAAKDITEVANTVKLWDDWTPAGVDTLKRKIAGTYRENSEAAKFVATTAKTIKNTLAEEVPGYRDMVKGYENASNLLKDMQKITGKGNAADADMVIKRVVSAMKSDSATKQELLKVITKETGSDLEKLAAGYQMSKIAPQGFLGKGAASIASLAGFFNPAAWSAIAMASPRVQGILFQSVGQALKAGTKIAPTAARTGGILARNYQQEE